MNTEPCSEDDTPSRVVAGDVIFLSHHTDGFESDDVTRQVRCTFVAVAVPLAIVGATLSDLVTITVYLKHLRDWPAARAVFGESFPEGCPAGMLLPATRLDPICLCMVDGIAYRSGGATRGTPYRSGSSPLP